jgi:hypothetical protein
VKQLQSKSCRFRAMRPSAEFPYCLRVQKVLSVSINQFRDGARISTVWSKIWFQNISRSWTSKLLANWLAAFRAFGKLTSSFCSK